MAKKGHFQIACSKYFDAVNHVDLGLGINHPNEFFEESQKLIKGDIKIEPKSNQQRTNVVKKEKLDSIEVGDIDMDLGDEDWNE